MKKLFVNRGLPGSGKTTTAKLLKSSHEAFGRTVVIASSDDFFVCPCCVNYNFALDRLGYAHTWCKKKAEKALQDGVNVVIIDNTNVSVSECRPYVEMGLKYGYEIEFLEPTTPWAFSLEELEKKNTHNVPREALERMLRRWVSFMTIEKALSNQPHGVMHEDEKASLAA